MISRDPADNYFSQYIRLRDRACRRCGSAVKFNEKGLPVSHQCSHYHGRRKESTRFDPLNCDTLCGGCHMYLTANPEEHRAWQIRTKGQEAYDQLTMLANIYKKKDRVMEALIWKEAVDNLLH